MTRRSFGITALAMLALPACASLPPQRDAVAMAAPVFSPERFFAGRTEGHGTLKIVASHPRAVHVLGAGMSSRTVPSCYPRS